MRGDKQQARMRKEIQRYTLDKPFTAEAGDRVQVLFSIVTSNSGKHTYKYKRGILAGYNKDGKYCYIKHETTGKLIKRHTEELIRLAKPEEAAANG